MRCYFTGVLTYTSLMINDVEHLFLCLLAICVCLLCKNFYPDFLLIFNCFFFCFFFFDVELDEPFIYAGY